MEEPIEDSTPVEEKMIPQSQVDNIVKTRLAREREKYSDYEELAKFKTEYEKRKEIETQRTLEEEKRYEELKKSWNEKEGQYKSLLGEKEKEIESIRISNSISSAVLKNNAYPDAVDLLKSRAVVRDGKVMIVGTDANGMSQEMTIDEGVKSFLNERPYLVKASSTNGSGTPTVGGSAGTVQRNLADELQSAINSGNLVKKREIKQQIRDSLAQRGFG